MAAEREVQCGYCDSEGLAYRLRSDRGDIGRWALPSKAGWYGPDGEYISVRAHWLCPQFQRIEYLPRQARYDTSASRRVGSWLHSSEAVAWVDQHLDSQTGPRSELSLIC